MQIPMFKRVTGILAGLLVAVVLMGGLADSAQAQALKVGYTDHEIIIVNLPAYQQVQQQLQQEYQTSQQNLQQQAQDLQEKMERYQKQQALLSAEVRTQREQELMQLQGQLQQAAQQKDQELAQREAELMQPLLERVQGAIDAVAERKGLDVVLRTQVGAQPLILYVNNKTVSDITADVARELGLEVPEETDTAAANN